MFSTTATPNLEALPVDFAALDTIETFHPNEQITGERRRDTAVIQSCGCPVAELSAKPRATRSATPASSVTAAMAICTISSRTW